MEFILICGPQAVGKMTVGQELAKRTPLKLFHNHMTIELVRDLIPLEEGGWALVKRLREDIFRAFLESGAYGIIYTVVWAFDCPGDWEYVENYLSMFREAGANVYIVELEADFDERLRRNNTPNRLEHKPSKRDLAWSERDVRDSAERWRLNSEPGEITEPNYLRIDNTNLSAEDAARAIKERFGFRE